MNPHSIELDGYYARSRGNSTIYLGTAGSHGNEQLQVTQGKGWEGLTVQVVFHPCKVAVQLPANGVLDVPWEATARSLTAMQGRIVFQGFDQDRLVNSTDLAYSVASHSPALGRDEQPYTPGIVEGVLNQMAADKDAILQAAQQTGQAKEAAAASAAEAASSAANAQQSAGTANTSASQAAASASQAAGSAASANETLTQVQTAGQEATEAIGTAQSEAIKAVGDAQSAAVQAVQGQQQTSVGAVQAAGTAAVDQVSQAGQQQVQAVKDEGTTQTTAVTNAGTAQVQAVNSAGTTQVQAVKDAETEALGNISAAAPALPAVSAAAAWQSVTAKPDGSGYNLAALAPIEATIRPTVTGNPAVCKDSAAWAFQGLKIYGKSTQDGTPSPENPVPIVSAGDGGNVQVSVKTGQLLDNTDGIKTSYKLPETLNPGTYTVSFETDATSVGFRLSKTTDISTDTAVSNNAESAGLGRLYLTVTTSFEANYIDISAQNATFVKNIMLNSGDSALPFEPYKSQSFTIFTHSGLPGIPVESGGNFTDSEGQQRVCDVVDYSTLKKVSKVYELHINSSMPFALNTSNENFAQFTTSIGSLGIAPNMKQALMCNRFKPGSQLNEQTKEASMWIYTESEGSTKALSLVIVVSKSIASTVGELKTWISENETVVLLPLATPIETDIPAEELAAYRALTTYGGTTVVSTAEPVAGIEASYVMDGNKYRESVDKRLAALEAAQTGI